jgi:hypothetical protein
VTFKLSDALVMVMEAAIDAGKRILVLIVKGLYSSQNSLKTVSHFLAQVGKFLARVLAQVGNLLMKRANLLAQPANLLAQPANLLVEALNGIVNDGANDFSGEFWHVISSAFDYR